MPTLQPPSAHSGGACALSAASAFPFFAGANETITVDQFRALSATADRRRLSDLDASTAGKLLDGLLSMERGPGLALPRRRSTAEDRARSPTRSSPPGIRAPTRQPAGLAVAGFTNALLWNALDFTKPSGFCGGVTGYWADPSPQ